MNQILLADDDPFVIQSLQTILEASGYKIVATCNNGADAATAFRARRPDLALLDIRMAGSTGLDAARDILQTDPEARILLLTTFKETDYVSQAIALGCKGYLLKQNVAGLIPAIEAVLAGNRVFDDEILPEARPATTTWKDPQLTDRENDIMVLVADGLNNREIAAELLLSEGTVRNHISLILNKLDLRDRTQLSAHYYKNLLNSH